MNLTETRSAVSAAAGESRDWKSAPIPELIHHIVDTHHVYLKSELPKLADMAGEVSKDGGTMASLRSVFLELKAELESHLWKEEVVLFPLILTLDGAQRTASQPPPTHCGSVNNPIRVMTMEHDGAKRAIEEMRRLTGGYSLPAAAEDRKQLYSALQRLEADLHRHIHLEEDILFPRASRLEASLCA